MFRTSKRNSTGPGPGFVASAVGGPVATFIPTHHVQEDILSIEAKRTKRLLAGVLAGTLALTVTPILGFTGTAGAAIEPTGPGNVCEDAPADEPFTDIQPADIAYDEINCMVNTEPEITKGTTPTTYSPNAPVTRRQMALFLYRTGLVAEANETSETAINELPEGDGDVPFSDIEADDPAFDEIDTLDDAEIAQGFGDGTFRPNAPVSRRQMAKFLVRLQEFLAPGSAPEATEDYFTDDNGDSGEDELNVLAEEGVFEGDGNGQVNPGDDITRRQMALVLTRKLEFFFEEGLIGRLFVEDDSVATSRPELQSARIVSTTTTGQATTANPAGTVVAYTFDEPLTAANAAAAAFHVYTGGPTTTRIDNAASTAAISAGDNRTVNVLFPGINTAAAAAGLSLATVDLGSVTDTQGQQSPEGDAAIGTGGQSTLAAGTTSAPDLQSVSGFRGTTTAGTVAVDFVFDQAAYVQGAGFFLVGTDGRVVTCTAPATTTSGNTTPSGQNTPGGNGTTTITVTCGQYTGGTLTAVTATAANTARGVVGATTVGTTPPAATTVNGVSGATCQTANTDTTPITNRCNALQASQTPDQASTTPDLVSASFAPATNTTSPDQVIYTFDTNVQPGTVDSTDFYVYNNNGVETQALATPAPQVNGNQVAVFFTNGTLANAVGANVRATAVTDVAGTNPANQADEVGVANSAATTLTPGRTGAPDLVSVALSSTTSGFSTVWTAVYTFDEALAADVTAAGVAPQLFLHLADGSRLACQAAGVVIGSGTNGLTTSQVACSSYAFVDGTPDQSGTNTGPATAAQVGASVLGTVDQLATPVVGNLADTADNYTPEGAEVTSGGTA